MKIPDQQVRWAALSLRDWEFCRKRDCPNKAVSSVRDRFFVLQWLLQSKNDFSKMHAMRRLLSEDASSARNLYRTSDDEVIDRIADLLISGRLHVHHSRARASLGGPWQDSTAGSSGRADAFVPFPISERRPRAPFAASPKPVVDSDPSTFSPETNFSAQAATLVAAANTGAAAACI
jgi:hypothetical protein